MTKDELFETATGLIDKPVRVQKHKGVIVQGVLQSVGESSDAGLRVQPDEDGFQEIMFVEISKITEVIPTA